MTDAEIERTSPPELTDLPEGFWEGAQLVMPVAKQAISLRVDEDILEWFRSLGPRYQTRMNAVLRSYMTQATKRTTPRVRRSRKGAA
ncbi:MAG: BrnA antitoxin family protein [Acidobacteria bacterium]|nr:BrnA antitoxin family protein [Acidobacteriota bacterium]